MQDYKNVFQKKSMVQQFLELFVTPKPKGATALKEYSQSFKHICAGCDGVTKNGSFYISGGGTKVLCGSCNKIAEILREVIGETEAIKFSLAKKALQRIVNCSPKEAGIIANKCLNSIEL